MRMDEDSILEFPCEIPIKIFGKNARSFRDTALGIVRSHYFDVQDAQVGERLSRGGKYLSLTITVETFSREQIDAVYRELSASDEVLMVL